VGVENDLEGVSMSAEWRNVPAVVDAARPVKASTARSVIAVPVVIAGAGDHAARRFLEFFTAQIRNKNTRMAYFRAVCHFFGWVEQHGIGELADIEPLHVAAYIETLQATAAKPTVKQHLAAIRMLFDWLIIGQVLAINPAHAVRGPKHVVRRGKAPVLTEEQARRLLESINTSTLVGLRDRALIGVMTYAFARIGAVVAMRVEDYYPAGKRWWVRLHEKGGKRHEMPAHHKLEAFIDEYLAAAGIRDDGKTPLFRSAVGKTDVLTDKSMDRVDAYRMVRRRTGDAGFKIKLGCHVFRATGITAYLEAGGTLENAQAMAAHESPRTAKLYDRTGDEITLDEVERIVI
jgi:site-specific recombinase XerD